MASVPVEDHLVAECGRWRGHVGWAVAVSGPFDPTAYFAAQLDALHAIGLLEADEVERWRRTFEGLGLRDPPLSDDIALRGRAERYLAELRAWEDTGELPDPDVALDVLEHLGVMSEEEVEAARGWPPEFPESGDDEAPRLVGAELRAVLLGPDEEIGGDRVVCVELYDDRVSVRGTSRSDLDAWAELELSDDAATEYENCGGGGSGGGPETLLHWVTDFVPAVPGGVQRLFLELAGRRFVLTLPQ